MIDLVEKKSRILQQLAKQHSCLALVLKSQENIFISSEEIYFKMISFGSGCIMFLNPQLLSWAREKFQKLPAEDIMDGENLFALEKKLRQYGHKLSGQHLRFVYDRQLSENIKQPSGFTYKFYEEDQIQELYVYPGYNMALNYKQDVLAIAAWKDDKLAALAGADNYWQDCWQIGVDTLAEYRNRGLASYLVQEIAAAIEKRGYVPFYTTWAANLASTKIALRCGFIPFMVEYFAEEC